MHQSLEPNRGRFTASKHANLTQPFRIFDELGGESCRFCGCRQYRLLVRANARNTGASLMAKCSRCGNQIIGYSLDQLTQDMNRCVDHDE